MTGKQRHIVNTTKRKYLKRVSAPVPRLLYTRHQTGDALGGVSNSTVIRLEQQGYLTAIKLSGSRTAKTFYAKEQVEALAKRGAAS